MLDIKKRFKKNFNEIFLGICLFGLCLIGGLLYFSFRAESVLQQSLHRDQFIQSSTIEDIYSQFEETNTMIARMVKNQGKVMYHYTQDDIVKKINTMSDGIDQLALLNPGDGPVLLKERFKRYADIVEVLLTQDGKTSAGRQATLYENQFLPIADDVHDLINTLEKTNQEKITINLDKIHSMIVGGLLLAVILALVLVVSTVLVRHLIKSLTADQQALVNERFSRMKTERDVQNVRFLLDRISQHLPLAVTAKEVGRNYQYMLWNKAAEEIFDITAAQVVGKSDYDHFDKTDADMVRLNDQRIMTTGETQEIKLERLETKRGARLVHSIKVPIYDDNGKPYLLLSMYNDITDLKRDEERLRMFEQVVESSSDAVFVSEAKLDDQGAKIIYVNDAFVSVSGYQKDEIVGKTTDILYGDAADTVQLAKLRKALSDKSQYQGEMINYNKDGGAYWSSLSLYPVKDKGGNVVHFAAIERDVTDAKRQEEVFKKAKEEAEAANIAKSEFLANMSHELRTPLNSILGMTKLMLESPMDKEQIDLASTVYRSSTILLEIVNDILDLSKIEANELQLEHIGFDYAKLLKQTMNALSPLASQKGLTLSLHGKLEGAPFMMGDPVRVGRILNNLIGNGIKYTDKGQVKVHVSYQQIGTKVLLNCSIEDSGIGIPEEKHDLIFTKFAQADNSTTRKYGGTGLGLAITKQLVELMGGTIGLKSTLGQGSTFWFSIPFDVAATEHHDLKTRSGGDVHRIIRSNRIAAADARVLVVEDHPLNQELIKRLLPKFGIQNFVIADNGVMALYELDTNNYDIVLMDCHMPEMNGYDTTKAIRLHEVETRNYLPIIAMTANAMAGDREKCLSFGMDDYLSKPIDANELKLALSCWIDFGANATTQIEATQDMSADVPVDLSLLHAFTDHDAELEKKFARIFVEQSTENLSALENNQTDGVNLDWRENAHALKGGSASLGAKGLAQLCADAQKMEDATAVQRAQALQKINTEYNAVIVYLTKQNLL